MKGKILIAVFSLILFFVPLAHAQTATTSPFGERIFYYSTLKSTAADFVAHAADIDIIAPQTYEVTAALTASGTVPADLASAAKASHVKVMPLIANHGFSQPLIHALLASTTAQNSLIASLASLARANGYVGWQFDFEHIAASDRDAYSAFVAKAAAALHADGLILSVAVVARAPGQSSDDPTSDFYKNWSGAYDYAPLASAADFLSFMAYDDPDSTGPSAPLSFVASALSNVLSSVPASKISLGIPLYYWGWSTVPAARITSGGTYSAAMAREDSYPSLSGFNAAYGAPWLIYRIGQKIYMIWYENEQSFAEKAALVNAYHLRGFSAWVLGSEDPGIWSALGK